MLKNVVYYSFNLILVILCSDTEQDARRKANCQSGSQVMLGSRTTEPSMEVLQLDRKSTSRLSCLTIPPTAMELTSRIAESSGPFSPPRFSTSDVSDEVIIFRDSWTTHRDDNASRPRNTHMRACPAQTIADEDEGA